MLHYVFFLTFLTGICIVCGESAGSFSPPPPSPADGQKQPDYSRPPDPEVVKAKLIKLFEEELDRNKDGYVTVDELRDQLKFVHQETMKGNLDVQWDYYTTAIKEQGGPGSEKPEAISWESYKKLAYADSGNQIQHPEERASMIEIQRKLERRWNKVDINGDKKVSKEEFKTFLYPEESEQTSDIVIVEAMEDVDKDKNNDVSLEEYMEHSKNIAGEEKHDPNWNQAQQGHFINYLDKNKDGSLSKEEFKDWILPPYDKYEAEAWRLMSLADQDRDTKLSKEDVLNHHEHFLVLQPPEYWIGEYQRKHDEF